MTGVLFACLAGMFLGALNITVRRAVSHSDDVDAGSAVIAMVACALVATAAVVSGSTLRVGELWPFLLIGSFVPGVSQLGVVRAVQSAGASRAGILFGMAPLASAAIAIVAFHEPLHWPLAVGTLLVVAGGVSLAREKGRPGSYRACGAVLALAVAVAFGIRDNLARAVSDDVAVDALAQATGVMLGASIVLLANVLRRGRVVPRVQATFAAFALSGVVTAVAQACLLAALDRGRVTVVAPLVGTGVLWTVVFSALFLRRSELVGRRLTAIAVLVVAGGVLVGAAQ